MRAQTMKDTVKTYLQRGTTARYGASWYNLLEANITAAVGPLDFIAVQCKKVTVLCMALGCSEIGCRGVECSAGLPPRYIPLWSVLVWLESRNPAEDKYSTLSTTGKRIQ